MIQEFSTRLYYPNPMSPQGIELELPEDSEVTIEIFTEGGIRVSLPVDNKKLLAGKHKVLVPIESLERGVYYCRLKATGTEASYTDTHTLFIE